MPLPSRSHNTSQSSVNDANSKRRGEEDQRMARHTCQPAHLRIPRPCPLPSHPVSRGQGRTFLGPLAAALGFSDAYLQAARAVLALDPCNSTPCILPHSEENHARSFGREPERVCHATLLRRSERLRKGREEGRGLSQQQQRVRDTGGDPVGREVGR